MKRKFLFIFYIFFISIFSFSGVLKVGVIQDKFTTEKINGKDYNDIILGILDQKLGYDLDITYGSWAEINSKFSQNEIDIIYPVERDYSDDSTVSFSENIYSQYFYIASQKEDIKDIGQLKNKKIYTLKGSTYGRYLRDILKDNDITAEILEVEDISLCEDFLTAQPSTHIQNILYKYKVGILPFSTIAYRGQDMGIISRINSILNNGYRTILTEHKNQVEMKFRRDFFLKILTPEELDYLSNLKSLDIAYEDNSLVSHYVPETGTHLGLIPLILGEFSAHLGVKINILNEPFEQWEQLLERFNREETDLISMVKTESREKNYIFSKKVFDIKVYRIGFKNPTPNLFSKSVGVLENSIEHILAKKYFKDSEIKTYNSLEKLIHGLENGEIRSTLNFDEKLVVGPQYMAENFYSVPMNLAFSKKNVLLRNVFDKFYTHIINKDTLLEEFTIAEKTYIDQKIDSFKKRSLFYLVVSVVVVFIMLLISVVTVGIFRVKRAEKLAELAFVDSLSLLGNRYSLNRFCKNMENRSGTAIIIDLDNFKQVNDVYGHDTGDSLIFHCAEILKKIFKPNEIFRISGDEYYVFSTSGEYREQIEKLENEMRYSPLLNKYSVSCSMGYYFKEKNLDFVSAFKYADMAMYSAKRLKGTASYEANEEFLKKNRKIAFIKENMKSAIQEEFYPAFQPKVSLVSNEEIQGAEALARWNSPEIGEVAPDIFIPLAESMKIIGYIDFKIAKEAIKSCKKWIVSGTVPGDFVISFNVSMYTFENYDVPEIMENLLKKYSLPGKNVELEITESLISQNLRETLVKLKKLKKLGIQIALDDFTVGHSTAGVLPFLPLDIVKFDRSLLLIMEKEREKGILIYTSLVNLVKNMGFKITSEGIEKKEDINFLKELGVEVAQGYFFGKPMKEEEFITRMKKPDSLI